MKALIKAICFAAFFSFIPFKMASAIEILYSSIYVKDCEEVSKYSKFMRNGSRKKVEKRLLVLAEKDNATHVVVTKYVDRSSEGKGIRVKAIGKRCAQDFAEY